ncbi:MAG: N-acyl homoserine lactonase family protein [Firmicutes bacterium]|jgi:glyoxylase-like metal-dependent hydrolase (beta-lactamase superfamily II)|nr:N-acyl homoserine lactonase family protein [Bacillota bacterium]
MKVYFFNSGVLKSEKQYFTAGRGVGDPFEVPVPFFLIEHKDGYVLFDTGNAYETIHNKHEHWGDVVAAYDPVMTEDQWVVNAIQKVGVKPEDIKYVILSHLHLDHAGGVGHFPNAKYIVQRKELHFAYVPDFYMKGAYIRKDFDKDVDWYILEGYDSDNFDVFGDGKIIVKFTPGHTPGHQSVLLNLEKSGPMLLTADSCYTTENIDENVLPGLVADPVSTVRTIEKFRFMRNQGVTVITGHDPESWESYKKAPDFYE